MSEFSKQYKKLNIEQKLAVDTIDGPLMVIAGPGTGKTQLLGMRVANILDKTDTLAENILCLTYTEAGAQNMQKRLTSFIGQLAYDVRISTYHAFGSDIVRTYNDYFENDPSLTPIDELGIDSVLRKIIADLPFTNLLNNADAYIKDIKSLISDCKRALLTPDDIRAVANANILFIKHANKIVTSELINVTRMDKKSVQAFQNLLTEFSKLKPQKIVQFNILDLLSMTTAQLIDALEHFKLTNKTNKLTKWKNKWLAKNHTGRWILDGRRANNKLLSGAEIYQQYNDTLTANHWFDYDDMIMRATKGLESSDEARFSLQEKYQYILLDEFQDTNPAQLKLIDLLTNNHVNEGRPNIMAVGDDDQAIYSFQGADYSNISNFINMYVDTKLITLSKNYRSHSDILHVAHNIAEQIENRIHHQHKTIDKILTAESKSLPNTTTIARHEFISETSQCAWIADEIEVLRKKDVPYCEIAIIAPKHRYLEPLVPFLKQNNIPMHYIKREDVLDSPLVNELLTMAKLVCSLTKDKLFTDELWSTVLSYSFWNIPTSTIWELSWQANTKKNSWDVLINQNNELKAIGLFFFRLSKLFESETMETMLDFLVGVTPLDLYEPNIDPFVSPFKAFYFNDHNDATSYWNALTQLSVLRRQLRDWKPNGENKTLYLADMLDFADAHRHAKIPVLNTNPHQENSDAVQILTAYKAKGLEYQAVFVISATDDVWGSKARSRSTNISLPPNLEYIRYASSTNDEKLRLFFVSITRAKTKLYLTSYTASLSGRATVSLKYLNETNDNGVIRNQTLPMKYNTVIRTEYNVNTPLVQELYWQQRHLNDAKQIQLRNLLEPRLNKYKISATHLNSFTDLEYSGPKTFFLNSILRFPKSIKAKGQYGNAIHETMFWIHKQLKLDGKLPSNQKIFTFICTRIESKGLNKKDTLEYIKQGQNSLKVYMAQSHAKFSADDEHEFDFAYQGAVMDGVILTGKIDKMQIDHKTKTIIVSDYKTSMPQTKWSTSSSSLHKYTQQLYFYKLLIEHSSKYRNYKVIKGIIEYTEPDDDGVIQTLELNFDNEVYNDTRKLVGLVWNHIKKLDFPDTSNYQSTVQGTISFEKDILAGII